MATGIPFPSANTLTGQTTVGMPLGSGITPPKPPIPFGSPGSFGAAAEQQGGDYDKMMSQYDELVNASGSGGQQAKQNFTPIAPQLSKYEPSSGLQSALAQFQSLAATGGLGSTDVQNIRARGISPIRAIYANAQRNLARQKNLQGGYSPNYGAASAKMAREQSEQLGQANTNLEATIAEMQQKGKLAATPEYARLQAQESQNQNLFNQHNADIINQINQQNALLPLEYAKVNQNIDDQTFGNRLQAIEGKRTLYGTTPALTATFGNQVVQAGQLRQQQEQQALQQQQLRSQQERDMLNFANSFGGRV